MTRNKNAPQAVNRHDTATLRIARHLLDIPIHEQPIIMDPNLAPDEVTIRVGTKLWDAVLHAKFDEPAEVSR